MAASNNFCKFSRNWPLWASSSHHWLGGCMLLRHEKVQVSHCLFTCLRVLLPHYFFLYLLITILTTIMPTYFKNLFKDCFWRACSGGGNYHLCFSSHLTDAALVKSTSDFRWRQRPLSLSWLYLNLSTAHSFSRSFLLLDLWYHTLLDYVSLWRRQFSHFFCWPLLHYLSSNFWNVTSLHSNVLGFFCLFNLHCLPKWIQPILWLYMLIYPKFTSLALMSVLSSGNVATQHLMLDI